MSGDELRARIDAIKRQIRLEDEVRRRGIELRAGSDNSSRLEGCCPFHDDRHPSLSLYTETQRYYCFGCGATGDVLDFVQAWDGCSFWQALDRLTLNASLTTEERVPRPGMVNRRDSQLPSHREPSKSQDHRRILTQVQDIYQRLLQETPHALQYLQMRGITKHTIAQSKLGYADGNTLRQILQGHEKQWRAAIQAGSSPRTGGNGWQAASFFQTSTHQDTFCG